MTSGLSDFAKAEAQLGRLRQALRSTRQKLDAARASRAELIAEVRREVRDAVLAVEIPNVKVPTLQKTGAAEAQTAICIVSDWQLSKTTPTYNSRVAVERLSRYFRKVVRHTEAMRQTAPVKECRIYLIGDLIEGELIFPGQAHRIDASLFRQIFDIGSGALANGIRTLLSSFEKVHVVGVIGNHGALGGWVSGGSRYYHPETNADAMLYEVTRLLLRNEDRLTWDPNIVRNERKWYAVDHIGRHGYMLFHGDQIPSSNSWGGIPFYGFWRRILGWANGGIPQKFRYSFSGHFHIPFQIPWGLHCCHWGNGSLESDNTYASENRANRSEPSQWLLYAHPQHGVTWERKIHLLSEKG
jgi:hypothetical protein